jgi:hypothetical protein
VTTGTINIIVGTDQRETIKTVIELLDLPGSGKVAVRTLLTKGSVMRFIVLMASIAIARSVPVISGVMAACALEFTMNSKELKVCVDMIE